MQAAEEEIGSTRQEEEETKKRVGLDGGLGIETAEEAEDAYPYLADAVQSVEEAIGALDDYSDTLLEYVQPKGRIR
jgi:hypothetical protein